MYEKNMHTKFGKKKHSYFEYIIKIIHKKIHLKLWNSTVNTIFSTYFLIIDLPNKFVGNFIGIGYYIGIEKKRNQLISKVYHNKNCLT